MTHTHTNCEICHNKQHNLPQKIGEIHIAEIPFEIHSVHPRWHTDTHNLAQSTKLAFFSITLLGDLIHTSLRWFWSQPGCTEPAKPLFTFQSHGTHAHTHTHTHTPAHARSSYSFCLTWFQKINAIFSLSTPGHLSGLVQPGVTV